MDLHTRKVDHALYLLTREYGRPATLYRQLTATTDPRTGLRSETRESFDVERVIVLPGRLRLTEVRGISLISANKRLVQGGQWETVDRHFMVRRGQVPELTTDDWLVFDGKRYDIEVLWSVELDAAYIIGGRAVAEPVSQIHTVRAESLLSLTGTTG